MAYKLDGAKFPTIDDLVDALYPMYADRMSEEEFRRHVETTAERTDAPPAESPRAEGEAEPEIP